MLRIRNTNRPQIFLLHFAGGSCYSFEFLRRYVHEKFEFIPLELPGRGKRHEERIILDREEAVSDYTRQIQRLRNEGPYLLYGHSMGASLGFTVAKEMEALDDAPCHLIVSGNAGPNVADLDENGKRKKRYLMSDEDFKEELRELGGVPEEVIRNKELYDFFNPILRADFEVLEKQEEQELHRSLSTPIFALMGSEEKFKDKIENWKKFTTRAFAARILRGDHFFINEHPQILARIMLDCFAQQQVQTTSDLS